MHRAMVATRATQWLGPWRDGAVVFSYHNVLSDGMPRGERALHVPRSRFREQIERIVQQRHVVPLAELLRRHQERRSLRGLAALTFDDGYRGVIRNALPILAEFAVPATIFVVSGALGRTEPFWWDLVADSAGGDVPERERLLTECAGEETRILGRSHAPATASWDDDYLPASAQQLSAVDGTRVALGVHTITHPNLAQVSAARRAQELGGCWKMLRDRFAATVPAVAYPYGGVNAAVAADAASEGLAGFGGTGPVTHDAPRSRLPRLFVGSAMTADALEVSAAGLRVN